MPNYKISQLTTATAVSATNQFEINQNAASRSLEVSVLSTYIRSGDSGKAIVVSVSTASDAVRITQTGTGNALVVEDSANPDSTPFVVDASGNVGIGTSSPGARLDVVSDANALGLNIRGRAADSIGALRFANNANSSELARIQAESSSNLLFTIGSSATERMRIDSSGNVGIGTSSPATKLDVVSAGTTPTIIQTRNGTTSVYLDANNGYSYLNTFTNHPMLFGTNNAERMRIDSSGKVGIGTSNPGARLQVDTATTDDGISITNTSSANTTAKQPRLLFRGTDTVGTGKDAASLVVAPADANYVGASLAFYTRGSDTNAERMRIDSSGNIIAGASAALATTATNGFLYVPTCAGTPTGTPTAVTGMAPIVVNTTNNKLYFYSGGAWRDAGP
jgi:hypothetical protein